MHMPSGTQWLIILLIVVLLFGAKKIPELAKGLGKGIKTFKDEMNTDDDKKIVQDNAHKIEKINEKDVFVKENNEEVKKA
ncbi:twin arginine translocation system, TatA/E family protein [Campylobacter subantarcticus LMG 24377]|uniref:Sec-independent protein translocase protein TatA n=2 Tax=Campylobacter subantarcticus TaxID=497724 RepID=A0A0A8HBP2_9BACT|nr:twin-arginine translocase TatA/TatE family subunit [Campylobacter subantarcticus]EAJ1260567.1 twin-arginine translocase TatA/TatE family subunit [Campylobacter lari]AJC91085.1 twin arginine translocation system, TatA/E family protein [Campylobacter subantarcticus LMG 24374]AJC92863.1 twin arginine translocation system, TatA/E family protein [Campylobacter subantarcticus LMG 24377]EAL3938287.1 twin-arginine translocase TatA/TatE family subunit [Campylobacter lari]MPB99213.1 twin-arginine tra